MDELFPALLINLLIISIIFSVILMALIQKIKLLSFIKESWQIWFLNLIFAFLLGIPFGMVFYGLDFYNSIWIGVFSFIGAPSIYNALKNQNIFGNRPSKNKPQ